LRQFLLRTILDHDAQRGGLPLEVTLFFERRKREVLLSSRGVLLLVALVVAVTALGIVGVLRAVSAAPDHSADKPNGDDARTLTVLAEVREQKVVDTGPQGPSQGDMRVVHTTLYNAEGTKKIGRHDQFCVLTDPGKKVQMTECVRTYTLPGGEIDSEGVSARSTLNDSQKPGGSDAITGGTGKYAGVGGEVRFGSRGDYVVQTFHFTD
jgi:hypothetical protein